MVNGPWLQLKPPAAGAPRRRARLPAEALGPGPDFSALAVEELDGTRFPHRAAASSASEVCGLVRPPSWILLAGPSG